MSTIPFHRIGEAQAGDSIVFENVQILSTEVHAAASEKLDYNNMNYKEILVNKGMGQVASIELEASGYQDLKVKFEGVVKIVVKESGKHIASELEYNKSYDQLNESEKSHVDTHVGGGIGGWFWNASASANYSVNKSRDQVHIEAKGTENIHKLDTNIKNSTVATMRIVVDSTVKVRPGMPAKIILKFSSLQIFSASKSYTVDDNSAGGATITDENGNDRGTVEGATVVNRKDGPIEGLDV